MYILGISAFYHDSAAALTKDGTIIAAAQEERFTRKKGDERFPGNAVRYCLREAGINLDEIDYVGFYDKPILTFDRLLETYLAFAPAGMKSFAKVMPIWIKDKLLQPRNILQELNDLELGGIKDDQILFSSHHYSHAASAFYPSPFREAAVLVMDGVGEWATTSLGVGSGADLKLTSEIRFPHSIGLLYSAFTYYLGFKVNDGEYKIMGLAPYGEPKFVDRILENLIDLKEDGSFRLDMRYFNYCTGLTMTNSKFDKLFDGIPPLKNAVQLTPRDMDIARSLQVVTEEVVLRLASTLHQQTGMKNLCMAGGVALNCVANGRILRESPFENIWIQPAAGDAGGAVGVALTVDRSFADKQEGERAKRKTAAKLDDVDGMQGAYLGPSFSANEIKETLIQHRAIFHQLDHETVLARTVDSLADEKVVGWFQGRMEFGPRSLGNRSILGDPRSHKMQRILNLKIKYRESFRPFAPAVLRERVSDYFELDGDSPYMLLVSDVKDSRRKAPSSEDEHLEGIAKLNLVRSDIPAITHVDYSARIQTVDGRSNPEFHRLLTLFETRTGCAVLVNTSFNIRDEPIVCSPKDALFCFLGTEMDVLVLGDFVLYKEEQQ